MIQFYLLSILFNAASGYTLIEGDKAADAGYQDRLPGDFKLSTENGTFRLVLGILTALMGVFKLLSAVKGDIPVIGDLVPALAGFAAGFVLIYENYRGHHTDIKESGKTGDFLFKNKRLVGFMALGAAVLHFLFPGVLLL